MAAVSDTLTFSATDGVSGVEVYDVIKDFDMEVELERFNASYKNIYVFEVDKFTITEYFLSNGFIAPKPTVTKQ